MTEKGHSPNSIVVRDGDVSSSVPRTLSSSQGQPGLSLVRLRHIRQRKPVSMKELLDIVEAALDLIAEDTTF